MENFITQTVPKHRYAPYHLGYNRQTQQSDRGLQNQWEQYRQYQQYHQNHQFQHCFYTNPAGYYPFPTMIYPQHPQIAPEFQNFQQYFQPHTQQEIVHQPPIMTGLPTSSSTYLPPSPIILTTEISQTVVDLNEELEIELIKAELEQLLTSLNTPSSSIPSKDDFLIEEILNGPTYPVVTPPRNTQLEAVTPPPYPHYEAITPPPSLLPESPVDSPSEESAATYPNRPLEAVTPPPYPHYEAITPPPYPHYEAITPPPCPQLENVNRPPKVIYEF